jgi:hypothetical protein
MTSDLPITGKCWYCDKATPHRFCKGTSCQRMYHYRKTHPEVKKVNHRKPREFSYTDHFPTDIQQRIDRIVERARENGTLGWARLA